MSILIAVPVFNRLKITEVCIQQLKKSIRAEDHIVIYNDHSTEFDHTSLASLDVETITLETKSNFGPDTIRWHNLQMFLESKHEHLYLTDSDAFHDPDFIRVLLTMYEKVGNRALPVCLYNSYYHNKPENIIFNKDGVSLKKTAPGISMLLDRGMVKTIVSKLSEAPDEHNAFDWDYRVCAYLKKLFITTNTSWLEHFGQGGLHYSQANIDTAINPTQFLQESKHPIDDYLKNNTPLPHNLS